MKGQAVIAGTVLALALGWGVGRYLPHGAPPVSPPPPVDRATAATLVLPKELKTLEARAWAAGLELPVLRGLIERVASEPGYHSYYDSPLRFLLGVFFEQDGTGAADQWLKIEADSQPEIDEEIRRWAEREPEAAEAWFSHSFDELCRYRRGELVVTVGREMMEGCAARSPELAVRWLMEKPEFFDRAALGVLTSALVEKRERDLLLRVAEWVREKGADPRHVLSTVDGGPLDSRGRTVAYLSFLDGDAALAVLAQVPAGDPRRKAWLEELKGLPGAPSE
jgi:hypothetical protein